jgi:hypothetical protein
MNKDNPFFVSFYIDTSMHLAPPDREFFWVCFRSFTFVAHTVLKKIKITAQNVAFGAVPLMRE